jgi:hypothetical protein
VALLKSGTAIIKMQRRHGYRWIPGVLLACSASAQTISEYQVKAAFLYKFAKFVEWPAQTFRNDQDPIHICVLGQDPFGGALAEAMEGKTVLGRPFLITGISDAGKASDCQILFVGSSERKHLSSIFADLRATGVLTVGETNGFATQGGMVNFKLVEGRVRLEINAEAAGQAKLRISSKVLNLAQIVTAAVKK